jgi:hypothetical protein
MLQIPHEILDLIKKSLNIKCPAIAQIRLKRVESSFVQRIFSFDPESSEGIRSIFYNETRNAANFRDKSEIAPLSISISSGVNRD